MHIASSSAVMPSAASRASSSRTTAKDSSRLDGRHPSATATTPVSACEDANAYTL